ncbi:MAG: sigma-70 family RNA polymerase sigma factor [Candidatus Cloacimonetes bacterium]|nr:sigma-70 family RNA polymerase sigma factor [Candidatus Cloacimonadota bacterium]
MSKAEFESILRSEGNRIFNYLLKILRNREDAEDLLQEVFLSFYKKMSNINEKAYLSYLYKTAYHKSLNLIKKEQVRRRISTEVPGNYMNNLTSEDPVETKDKNEIIMNAFRMLKPGDALLLELRYYRKTSYKDIARLLALSESAVDSRLVRAKRRLKKIILQNKDMSDVINDGGNKK